MPDQNTSGYSRLRDLGPALASARRKTGKDQAEFAALALVSRANLSRYETGAEIPQPKTLQRLLEALETDLGALMRDQDGGAAIDETQPPEPTGSDSGNAAVALRVILRYESELTAKEARIAELEARVRHLESP